MNKSKRSKVTKLTTDVNLPPSILMELNFQRRRNKIGAFFKLGFGHAFSYVAHRNLRAFLFYLPNFILFLTNNGTHNRFNFIRLFLSNCMYPTETFPFFFYFIGFSFFLLTFHATDNQFNFIGSSSLLLGPQHTLCLHHIFISFIGMCNHTSASHVK